MATTPCLNIWSFSASQVRTCSVSCEDEPRQPQSYTSRIETPTIRLSNVWIASVLREQSSPFLPLLGGIRKQFSVELRNPSCGSKIRMNIRHRHTLVITMYHTSRNSPSRQIYPQGYQSHVCRFWRIALINQHRLWSAVFITQEDRRSFAEARLYPVTLGVMVEAEKNWAKSIRIVHGCYPTNLTLASGTSNFNSSLKPSTLTAFVRWTSNLTATGDLSRKEHGSRWEAVDFSLQLFQNRHPHMEERGRGPRRSSILHPTLCSSFTPPDLHGGLEQLSHTGQQPDLLLLRIRSRLHTLENQYGGFSVTHV